MTRPMLRGSRAAGAQQMGSAHEGTGRARGAPQVEMDPAVQKVVHVESSSLTLAGRAITARSLPGTPAAAAPASRLCTGQMTWTKRRQCWRPTAIPCLTIGNIWF